MDILVERCAALDVHKDTGAAQLKGADGVGVPVGWVVGAAA